MESYIEDVAGLLAALVLLPIMLFVVWPAAFIFDPHIGLFRRASSI